MDFNSVDNVLDFAIKNEEAARAFYLDLSEKMDNKAMRRVFMDFAEEELKHKRKLLYVKEGKLLEPSKNKILDLKIGDYLADVEEEDDIDYQKALILAMKREKNAFKLYTDLAESIEDNEGLKNTFLALAQEEAKHKLYFEREYDNEILKQN
ncbi:ferritin family protein [candidate division KSB1 bacterium]